MMDVRDAVLNVATWLKWVKETNGANRGEAVDQIIKVTGLDPAKRYPWCACFVAACGYAVMRKNWPLKKVAGCMSLYDDGRGKGLVGTRPIRGAIFLMWGKAYDGKERFKHTGFITEVNDDGSCQTVEGNTSPDGSPEGTGVFLRTRTFGPKDRYIYWWDGV